MDRGRLLAVDAPGALREAFHGSVAEFQARPRREAAAFLRRSGGVGDVESFGDRLHATLPGPGRGEAEEAVRRLADILRGAGIAVESARPVPPSLEDVFIARIRSSGAGPGAGA